MFRLYFPCGSLGALAEELARRNVSKFSRANGGGSCNGGAWPRFLKNRLYVGEVVYRGGHYPA
jgi:hypothetical protein